MQTTGYPTLEQLGTTEEAVKDNKPQFLRLAKANVISGLLLIAVLLFWFTWHEPIMPQSYGSLAELGLSYNFTVFKASACEDCGSFMSAVGYTILTGAGVFFLYWTVVGTHLITKAAFFVSVNSQASAGLVVWLLGMYFFIVPWLDVWLNLFAQLVFQACIWVGWDIPLIIWSVMHNGTIVSGSGYFWWS